MNSFNRGEWSEFYGLLYLLANPELRLVDSDLNDLNKSIFIIKTIILDSKLKLEYLINDDGNILIYADKEYIQSFTRDEINKELSKLLNAILEHNERLGAFTILTSEEFVNSFTNNCSFKSKSRNKYDISTLCFDNIKQEDVLLKYSVKSSLGSPATILNSSSNTNFKFKIKNFPLDKINDVNSIETRTKLLDRINKIKSYENTEIVFDSVLSEAFEFNLKMVDSLMPQYLANTLLYSYEHDNKNLNEIFMLANSQLDADIAKKKLGDFLNGISFGFIPGDKCNGYNEVNGGLIIIKNNGEVVVLDLLYYPNEVSKYLIKQSKLDSPSTHRYHMLELFEENGECYFTLNLQVRYKR